MNSVPVLPKADFEKRYLLNSTLKIGMKKHEIVRFQ